MWKVQPLQGAHCAVEPGLAGARRPEQCDNTLLFQMNSLKTENSCLGLCGGRVTESSRTKSPQTAKALCKEEYTAIYFLFFLFSAFCAAVGSINTSFFLHWESAFCPKGTLNGSLSLFRVLNVWIPSAEKKNERKLQLFIWRFIWRLCLTRQLLDDNLEGFKLSWQFRPLITEVINAFWDFEQPCLSRL